MRLQAWQGRRRTCATRGAIAWARTPALSYSSGARTRSGSGRRGAAPERGSSAPAPECGARPAIHPRLALRCRAPRHGRHFRPGAARRRRRLHAGLPRPLRTGPRARRPRRSADGPGRLDPPASRRIRRPGRHGCCAVGSRTPARRPCLGGRQRNAGGLQLGWIRARTLIGRQPAMVPVHGLGQQSRCPAAPGRWRSSWRQHADAVGPVVLPLGHGRRRSPRPHPCGGHWGRRSRRAGETEARRHQRLRTPRPDWSLGIGGRHGP